MSKRQTGRLTNQHISSGGASGIFGEDAQVGIPSKSMQVDFYQGVTEIGITNKNRQVNAV